MFLATFSQCLTQIQTNDADQRELKRNTVNNNMHNLPEPFLVTLSECLTQVGVRTEVKRGLTFLVLHVQISSIGCQEARYGRTGLLVCSWRSQAHQELQHTVQWGMSCRILCDFNNEVMSQYKPLYYASDCFLTQCEQATQ